MLRLKATAGVTRHSPRIVCSTEAAAPGCPSTCAYIAPVARRPKIAVPANSAPTTPRTEK
jgi:hypothetical protein